MSLQMLVVYAPPLQRVFGTHAMSLTDWGAVCAAALVPTVLIDVLKRVAARRAA